MFLNYLIIFIILMMSVAFFTIMERKLLGSIHMRLGPSKAGFLGILQPFYDALKLFSKSMNFINKISQFYWNISPLLSFFFFMIIIIFFPLKMENNFFSNNMLILMLFLGLPNFSIFWSSFFSLNKFSIISSKRLISQLISYEMGLLFMFISLSFISSSLNLEDMKMNIQNFFIMKYFLMIMVFILILSESSRIPFDFIEGESEMVSGFNIEFSSSYFSLFFIFEYGMMLFFSILMSFLLLKVFFSIMLIFLFILIRSSFIRIRYDQMMMFIWKIIYPLFISFMIFIYFF